MVSPSRTPAASTLRPSVGQKCSAQLRPEAGASRDRPKPQDRGAAAHLNPHVGSRTWLSCARSCPSVGSVSGTSSSCVRL